MNVIKSLSNEQTFNGTYEITDSTKFDARRHSKKLQNLMNGLDLDRFQFPSNASPKLYDSFSSTQKSSKVA